MKPVAFWEIGMHPVTGRLSYAFNQNKNKKGDLKAIKERALQKELNNQHSKFKL